MTKTKIERLDAGHGGASPRVSDRHHEARPDGGQGDLVRQLGKLRATERTRRALLQAAGRSVRSTDLKLYVRDVDGACTRQIARLQEALGSLNRPKGEPAVGPGRPEVRRLGTGAPAIRAVLELGGRSLDGYGDACTLARDMGRADIVSLLRRSLREHFREKARFDTDGPGGDQADGGR